MTTTEERKIMQDRQYDGNGHKSPQWWPSRYGPQDRIGSGNELTPTGTLRALSIPHLGKVLELGRLLEQGVPTYPAREWSQLVLAHSSIMPFGAGGSEMTSFDEHVSQTYQIGTHLDGLGHCGIAGRFYNGLHYSDFFSPTGLREIGIENALPWVTRGVCLNIAAVVGVERLPGGFVIDPEHLEAAQIAQSIQVEAGDAVLLHTGWGDLWMVDNAKYQREEPGVGWAGAHWLTSRHASVVGADNGAFEVVPFEDESKPYVCHQHLLTETGTYILENPNTRPLIDAGVSEFLFIMAPNKTQGSTGSMVAPLAVI